MKQLTKQQKLFVTEYIKTLNGEASAKAAGYKSKNLREIATNLLAENLIIKEINSITSIECVNDIYIIIFTAYQ